MGRQDKPSRQPKMKMDSRQRNLRRNQIILVILSGILIVSMVLSLIVNQ